MVDSGDKAPKISPAFCELGQWVSLDHSAEAGIIPVFFAFSNAIPKIYQGVADLTTLNIGVTLN
jgi:hypothetical protein